ncbi:aminopeptidase P family protein [Azospirillum halopraeferens]|uniref:aminopeptidase P family protein n=1 Tax=Azospirillum halopraeferens TaxID=34010 RepID=UPI0003F63BA8|nr:aminopeptidase P family protein [Azospirillum halopraeferens]
MSNDAYGYRGDGDLADRLRQAGLSLTVDEAKALLAGVLAAPPTHDGDSWLDLFGPALPGETADALRALKAALEAQAAPASPDAAGRLRALRDALRDRGVDGFVVPRSDEHQGEYVPAGARRLAWLTGFTGSAGMAVVAPERAALFVDGRYTLQARAEVPETLYEHRHLTDDPLAEWVAAALPAGGRLGYDPWLHTVGWVEKTRRDLDRAGIALMAVADNPVDAVWPGRPPAPLTPVVAHDTAFAGTTSADKRADVAARLRRDGVAAAVLTQPDSIAWLLNLRGGDVPCTPLPLSFAIIADDGGVELFIDRRKLVPGVDDHLGGAVTVRPPDALGAALDDLGRSGRKVLADPATGAAWIFDRLDGAGARVERGADPCALPKACKNAVELEGTRAAHRRDGVAMVRFLRWLSREAAAGAVTEMDAAAMLESLRAEGALFRGLSFETISGAGPNGAIVHYRVSPETNRRLEPGSLYLIDSGAQYLDGTTDVTRTVAIGEPTVEMRERFTLVLKGHIAVSTARFPRGTSGSQLDTLARHPLWQAGLDYDHGTGHGVGSYLSVHEGPQRISKVPNTVALLPGMILSNEPGYYKAGAYGIRIENLIVVQAMDDAVAAERPMLGFEVLTLAPIDLALIEPSLLSNAEVAWLNAYHLRVRHELTPLLDADTAAWLAAATGPLMV